MRRLIVSAIAVVSVPTTSLFANARGLGDLIGGGVGRARQADRL